MFVHQQKYAVPKGLKAVVFLNAGGTEVRESLDELGVTQASFLFSTESDEAFAATDNKKRSLLIKIPKKEAAKIAP